MLIASQKLKGGETKFVTVQIIISASLNTKNKVISIVSYTNHTHVENLSILT